MRVIAKEKCINPFTNEIQTIKGKEYDAKNKLYGSIWVKDESNEYHEYFVEDFEIIK